MDTHGSYVARDQNPTVLRRNAQNLRIGRAFWNRPRRRPEVYRGLPPEHTFSNVGIDISVSLKSDLQASFAAASFLARSKRSILS